MALALALVLSFASGCGGSGTRSQAGPAASATTTPATHASPADAARRHRRRAHPHHRRHVPSPGALPQTAQRPSAATATFHGEMQALWRGVRTRSARDAMVAFFPERAYAQVKAIGDPAADWSQRLVGDYELDIVAAHALLGADAGAARLVAVDVPGEDAHWVAPGACYNRVGYYEMPNSRLVYRQRGEVRSFGIASMISWRGRWYVVHLGAVDRSAAEGIVDDPQGGAGASVPSSTC